MEVNSKTETIRKITNSLFSHNAYEDLEISMRSELLANAEGALGRRASIKLAVLTTALRDKPQDFGKILQLATKHSADLTICALQCVEVAWTVSTIARDLRLRNMKNILPYLVETCLQINGMQRYEVQLCLYQNISLALETLSQSSLEISLDALAMAGPVIASPAQPGEPAILQAERLRIITWAVLRGFRYETYGHTLEKWALSLSINSDANRVSKKTLSDSNIEVLNFAGIL